MHPIDESSVLHGFDFKDFIEKDVELFILISAYDNTFAQIVHNRYSYLGEDIVNNAKYKRPFYTDEAGNTVLDVAGLGEFELLSWGMDIFYAEPNAGAWPVQSLSKQVCDCLSCKSKPKIESKVSKAADSGRLVDNTNQEYPCGGES